MSAQPDPLEQILIDLATAVVVANTAGIPTAPAILSAKAALTAWHEKELAEAEIRMGEAVIERMRQANYQWEKAESFIQSYQDQKLDNIHNLKSLAHHNERSE